MRPVGLFPPASLPPPPQPAPQWSGPVAGCGFGFWTERCVLGAADCGSAWPRPRWLYPGQPWRHGGAQDGPSAVSGAGPGKATQGECWRDQGSSAQGSRKPSRPGKEAADFGFGVPAAVVGGPEASLHLPPAPPGSQAVARFVGCLGRFLFGGRGPGHEDGEESIA